MRLGFWAIAARKNSSLARLNPHSRVHSKRIVVFRCANSVSTFLRLLRERSKPGVPARPRAMSRDSSWTVLVSLRLHLRTAARFCGQTRQSWVLAR